MFWYPVHRHRLPAIISTASSRVGAGLAARHAVTVVRKPGVQKPHCSAWHSWNACCTGERPDGRPASGSPANPSTVVTRCPDTDTAKIRQDRTGASSSSTVQAPHTPCSHPTWVPVSPRSCRRKSDSVRLAATVADRVPPLTVSFTSCNDSRCPSAPSCRPHCLPRSRDRLSGGANGQHTGQMPAVVRGGVQVGLRIDGRREPGRRRSSSPASHASRQIDHQRGVGDGQVPAAQRTDDRRVRPVRRSRRPRRARNRRCGGRSRRRR